MQNELGNILIYKNEKGDTKIDIYFESDTIWMSQKSLAELYDVNIRTINEHIKNIYSEGELVEEATIRNFRIVQNEGDRTVTREVMHYNLDMILAIGYRVRSNTGNHFRQWATDVLTEYMKKGFVMNDERLKNPTKFGDDYFDELLERIRDIRSSERRFYKKVTDIFATSIDYDNNTEIAQQFFQTIQNKLHYAVHGMTAPEVIVDRADATKDNMGLTSFKGAKVRKGDVKIAKNYLSQQELSLLNRIVTMFLDYAELQAMNRKPMKMSDWIQKTDSFLEFNGQGILNNAGKVSREVADKRALEQYELYDYNRKSNNENIIIDDIVDEVKRLR